MAIISTLRRSKRLAERNNPLADERGKPPIVEPLDSLSALPIELFCMIMNMLEVWEQFTVRRVCHSWKDKLEWTLNRVPKECLKLNVKSLIGQAVQGARCMRTWSPYQSQHRMYFEFMYKEDAQAEKAEISIWDRAFNSDTARVIGRMFSRVKTMIIYWDTEDSDAAIDNLVVLLSQFTRLCSVIHTFGLIVSGNMANNLALSKIAAAITGHLMPLKELHLMVPLGTQTPNEHGANPTVALHSLVRLNGSQFVTTISFTSLFDLPNFLEVVGKGLRAASVHGVRLQLGSLSFPFNYRNDYFENHLLTPLNTNRGKFAHVTRLQLLNITTRESVKRLLEYFPNVEQLFLHFHPSMEKHVFGLEWLRAIKPLTKLTDLTLLNFYFERKLFEWTRQYRADEMVNLSQVRKLTIASHDLFYFLRKACNPIGSPFMPRLKPVDIADTINMRFSGLQELNMWSGDAELHQTPQSSWQALEQSLNRQLPLSLLNHPGLRVNIQLRHPLMFYFYRTKPAQLLARYRNAIAASNAHQLDARQAFFNDLIERRQNRTDILNRARGRILLRRAVGEMRRNQQARARAQQQQAAAAQARAQPAAVEARAEPAANQAPAQLEVANARARPFAARTSARQAAVRARARQAEAV